MTRAPLIEAEFIRMVRPHEWTASAGPARRPVGGGEVVPRGQGVGVLRAQHPFPVGQGLLVQPDRLGGPARLLVSGGEVVPLSGCAGGPGRASARRRPGPARAARSPRRTGPPPRRRGQGCSASPGCRGGPGLAPVPGRPGSARAARSLGGPARRLVCVGEVVREPKVCGWSGPSTRRRCGRPRPDLPDLKQLVPFPVAQSALASSR
jgi:hypothetical protein